MGNALDGCNGCMNVFGWIWNHVMGTLFILGGIYFMFWQGNFLMGIVGIGIGIYFYWTKSWTRKTIAVIAGEDPEQPEGQQVVATADQLAAPTTAGSAKAAWAPTPTGSVSQRKTVIKNVFLFASLAFGLLAAQELPTDGESIGFFLVVYSALTLACFFVYARTTLHRATEDELPALPWVEMIIAVLTAAFSPNASHVSYTTPEAAAASAERTANPVTGTAQAAAAPSAPVPPGSVTKRKLIIRNVIGAAGLVIMVFGLGALKEDFGSFFTILVVYGVPAALLLVLASRVRFDRDIEDERPAAPWIDSIVATLKEALARRSVIEALPAVPMAPAALAPLDAAPADEPVESASPATGRSPFAPVADAVRRNPKILIIGVGALVAITLLFYGGVAVKNRFFGPAAGTGLESRVAAASPGDSPGMVLTMVESASDGSPKSVNLKEIDNEGSSDRFSIELKDSYHYSIDGVETSLESFFEYAKANISAECDVSYTSDGIWSLEIVGGGDAEAPTQSSGGNSTGEVSEPDSNRVAGPEASEGDTPAASAPASHARRLLDLLAQARSDGTSRILEVTFSPPDSEASELLWFAPSSSPEEWYALDNSELGECYVDQKIVTATEFRDAVAAGVLHGMVNFTRDRVYDFSISTDGY